MALRGTHLTGEKVDLIAPAFNAQPILNPESRSLDFFFGSWSPGETTG